MKQNTLIKFINNKFLKIHYHFKHKCVICKEPGNLKDIEIPCYHTYYIRYHESCVSKVASNPKLYTHRQVDSILEIINYLDREEKYAKKLEEERKERIKKNEKLLKIYTNKW